MVWTAPITFVPNSVLTASQLNTYLRDNMLETMPARSVHAGSHFAVVSRGMIAERTTMSGFVGTDENTTSTDYTDLATPGPTVTASTSVSAVVFLYCQQYAVTGGSPGNGGPAWMSYEVSGDTQSDASDNRAIEWQQPVDTSGQAWGAAILHADLTPGINTFTCKYRVSGTRTGHWVNRRIAVFPL
jgi:hypothetical protein